MLATKDYGNDIQEDLNAIVGYDETVNNAIVRHTLDLKNSSNFAKSKSTKCNFSWY